MRTNQATMVSADWDGVERETVEKIRLLKVLVKQLEPGPLSDKICNDLVLPALAKLGAFNTSVQIHEERDDGEMDVELRNTTGAFHDSYMATISNQAAGGSSN